MSSVGTDLRPAAGRRWAGRWDQHVEHGPAGTRSFAVYTPPGLRPGVPVPLVVVLHGCRQSALDAALGTGVNELADRVGFVAVYPEQGTADNVRRCWNWFDPRHQGRGAGEPAEIARITERVLRGHGAVTLDRNRVHAMGLSAGGAMAGILAATYPDVFASVGIHSAPPYRAARSVGTALVAMKSGGPQPERQGRLAHAAMGPWARVVPVMVVQGDADRTVWAGNGNRVVRQWLATSRLATGQVAAFQHDRPDVVHDVRVPGGLGYTVRGWDDAAGRPVVRYWRVAGLGHAWSGGSPDGSFTDPRGPAATEAMLELFWQSPMDRDVDPPDRRPRWRVLGRAVRRLRPGQRRRR